MRHQKRNSLILFSVLLLTSPVRALEPADLVVVNAKVVAIDKACPRANAIAVAGEWIVRVGTDEEVRPYIEQGKTKVIDARGRLVVPGFNDAHVHVLSGGRSLLNLDFRNLSDIKIIRQMVKDRVSQVKPGELIRGRSWDHELFPDKAWPTKYMLDEVAPNNPVILSRVDGHSVWVNSLVLKQSKITRDTPDPAGGKILRDPNTGEPTGILKETAQGLIRAVESPTSEDRYAHDCDALDKALSLARQKGVTSLQDMTWGDLRSLETLKNTGRLTARITFGVTLTDDPKRLQDYDRLRKKYSAENNWVRLGLLKGFIDGNYSSGTDWPVEPIDHLEGLYAAVTREDRAGEPGDGWFPDQKLSMEKAIELYTLGLAYAEFTEDRKGSIKKGYLADLVIFNRDLLTVRSDQIMKAQVVYTIVGGKVVYEH